VFVRTPRFTEEEARAAIALADCWAAALRLLGMRVAGGNHKTLQKWASIWEISTEHFDMAAVRARTPRRALPLEEILIEGSNYKRSSLKRRLYEEGIKQPRCELCGQGEVWRGKRISLILDHINGDATDNRLENLRIACPNCAASFETHCGRNKNRKHAQRACAHCGTEFHPKYAQQRHCSHRCGHMSARVRCPKPESRKVERPPYEQLMRELEDSNYSAVGRKYGVSDNAILKWVRAYEREGRSAIAA
jgi:hypothetical protein